MAIPYGPEGLANVLKLQGFKNVSGRRRVLPGAQFMEDMYAPPPELDGTNDDVDMSASQPPPSPESAEIAQGYDVRANQVLNPTTQKHVMGAEELETENMWSNLGRSLAHQVKTPTSEQPYQAVPESPPIETQEVQWDEGLPTTSSSQELAQSQPPTEQAPSIWSALGDYLSPSKRREASIENRKMIESAQRAKQGLPLEVEDENLPEPQQKLDHAELDRAQQEPWQVAVYGASDEFANHPELVQELKEYTGVDYTPQVQEMTTQYEQALTALDKGLSSVDKGLEEQTKRILKRIEQNETTDNDKFFIGLALLMPLLVGAALGKEAGLGAFAGAASGIAENYARREKNIRADEELLRDLYKDMQTGNLKRSEIELERVKIPEQVKKGLPKDELEDLKNMKKVVIREGGKDQIVAEGPEVLPDLVADLRYFNTPKKREKLHEIAGKLEEEKSALLRANDATRDVINAVKQLKDPSWMGKALSLALSEGVDAGGVSLSGQSIKKLYKQNAPTIKDENGRDVNAAVYLDSKIEQIKDAYRRNEQMRAFTNTVANHIGSMAENPLYSGLKPDDLITQMLILRDRGQHFFTDRAHSQGFFREPIIRELGASNRDLYKGLNKREEKKILERDKQLLFKG